MIALLKGKIYSKSSTEIIIDCNGVGYQVTISVNTSEKLPDSGSETQIFTLLIPREDSLTLYGFTEESEREAFKMLISISGIGPKSAIGILSSVSVDELQEYVLTNNLHSLQKLPGVGKKTAERLLLELKDKAGKIAIPQTKTKTNLNVFISEALAAMITLGYSKPIAEKAIRQAADELQGQDASIEFIIKKALKYAMK